MLNKKLILSFIVLATFFVEGCSPLPNKSEINNTNNNSNLSSNEIMQTMTANNIPENLLTTRKVNPYCPAEDTSENTIGVGDLLHVTVYDEDDLSGDYQINNTGHLLMPLIEDILLENCTIKQAESLIKSQYADGYLINPLITVKFLKYRPFYILGEVNNPGQYNFEIGTSIIKAVAIAGGFTENSNKDVFKILMLSPNEQPYYLDKPIEFHIKAGTVIIVQEKL